MIYKKQMAEVSKKPLQHCAEAQPTKSYTHIPRLAKQNLTFMGFTHVLPYCGNDGNVGGTACSWLDRKMIYTFFEWG